MKRNHSNQNKNKKAELRKLVLAQLAKMRKKMKNEHPGMLEGLRSKIEESKKSDKKQKAVKPLQKHVPKEPQAPELVIDHNKNMQTIEMMLNLKSDNPGFEKAVKAIISKQKR